MLNMEQPHLVQFPPPDLVRGCPPSLCEGGPQGPACHSPIPQPAFGVLHPSLLLMAGTHSWQPTDRQTESKGPKVNSFRVRQAAGDIQDYNCDMETTAGVVNSLWSDFNHFYFLGNFSLGATSNGWCDTELKDKIRDFLYNITFLLLHVRHVFSNFTPFRLRE